MEILQNDIFGKKHQTKEEKMKKTTPSQTKDFINVTLQNGLNDQNASADAMLIHRVLQRKLIYSGLNTSKYKSAFLKILKNEMEIKKGKIDQISAVRDSLIEFFIKSKF